MLNLDKMNARLEEVLADETGESLSKWLESKRATTIQNLSKDWYLKFLAEKKSVNTYRTAHVGTSYQTAITPSPQYTFPESVCSVSMDQNLPEAA